MKKKLEEDSREIFEKISKETGQLKNNLENQGKDMIHKINSKNDARKKEADAIKAKIEQEKLELQKYMENVSKDMKNKLEQEKESLRIKMEKDAAILKEKMEKDNAERN